MRPRHRQQEKSDKRFAVISFHDEEETLYVIPSKWLKENVADQLYYCSWPPYHNNARIRRAVLEDETPDSSWVTCNAKLIRKCRTYDSAESILKAIMMVSDRRAQLLYKYKRDSLSLQNDTPANRAKVTTTALPYVTCLSSVSTDNESSLPEIICEEVTTENGGSSAESLPKVIDPQYSSIEQKCHTCSNSQELMNQILAELKTMKSHLVQQKQTINNQTKLILSIRGPSASMVSSFQEDEMKFHEQLPLKTVDELYEMDATLSSTEHGLNAMIFTLCDVGGTDLKNEIRRMLRKLFTDELATHMTLLGTKDKLSLSELNIAKALNGAIKKSPFYKDKSEAEEIIRNWLRHAKARSKPSS